MTSRSFSISAGSMSGFRIRSKITGRARSAWTLATLHQKDVISRSVAAFIMPPTPSTASEIARAVGQLRVPLKGRCSRKWDRPASSSGS